MYTDNNEKGILVFGEGPTQGLDDITIMTEAKYSITFSRSQRKLCLSLHYNGSNSFLLVNTTKVNQFKAKDSEVKPYPLCLGNISRYFSVNSVIRNRIKWLRVRFFC